MIVPFYIRVAIESFQSLENNRMVGNNHVCPYRNGFFHNRFRAIQGNQYRRHRIGLSPHEQARIVIRFLQRERCPRLQRRCHIPDGQLICILHASNILARVHNPYF